MASAELLDFNQVQEQSPATGDQPSTSGGLLTWNFRADPNLAWDPSQSFFVMELSVETFTSTIVANYYTQWQRKYLPDYKDFHAFFPLRCFTSMTHIIDGVTVAHTNQPFADKIMQEKYLKDASLSNMSNFEAVNLARSIDDFNAAHNLFMAQSGAEGGVVQSSPSEYVKLHNRFRIRQSAGTAEGCYTVMFQPPFDMWTKHQRISGGNHQIQLNMRAAVGAREGSSTDPTALLWGGYMQTTERGRSAFEAARAIFDQADGEGSVTDTWGHRAWASNQFTDGLGVGQDAAGADTQSEKIRNTAIAEYFPGSGTRTADLRSATGLRVDIKSIRLMRRMVRFTVERPISMEEFNTTEMAFFHGTPLKGSDNPVDGQVFSQTQNFLLPASTFAIGFYWRSATDSFYNMFDANRIIRVAGTGEANSVYYDPELRLNQFYFTYGGETYPSQRVTGIWNGSSSAGPGAVKMQALTHMLQGVMNTDMDRYNVNYGGDGLLDRMDASSFLFPVSKHNNSDNSDLQVFYDCNPQNRLQLNVGDAPAGVALPTPSVSLVCVAFYDARVELAYNAANQLEKVTKTEWK